MIHPQREPYMIAETLIQQRPRAEVLPVFFVAWDDLTVRSCIEEGGLGKCREKRKMPGERGREKETADVVHTYRGLRGKPVRHGCAVMKSMAMKTTAMKITSSICFRPAALLMRH